MEILEKTPTKLKLRYRPVGLWILSGICAFVVPMVWLRLAYSQTWMFYLGWFPLIPLFFFLAGMYSIISSGGSFTLEVDKNLGCLTLSQYFLFRKKTLGQPIRAIIDVEIAERNRDRLTSNHIVLVLKSGHALPLDLYRTADWREKQKIVNLIREFLGFPPR